MRLGSGADRRPPPVAGISKARAEAFSDGVFAIAITLLVLSIAQPDDYRHLGHQLLHRWPSLAAYAVSFAIIGIMWLNHHSVFSHLERVDRGAVYLNLLLLATIAFLPYPTGVLGQALAKGQGTETAALVYGVTMALNAYAWSALWVHASRRRRLLVPAFPESERARATFAFTIGSFAYSVAVLVAVWSAAAFLALQAAFALYYAIDPLTRRPGRRHGKSPGGSAAGAGHDPR